MQAYDVRIKNLTSEKYALLLSSRKDKKPSGCTFSDSM